MRAAVIESSTATPSFTEHPDPPPPMGTQVAVRLSAAALNPIDLQIASGSHPLGAPRYPYVPGCEGVGVVEGGDPSWVGRRVRVQAAGGFVDGTLAQRIVVDSSACAPVPEGLPDPVAAAIGVVGASAYLALRTARLQPGESVLVAGANGPFGRAFVQCARIQGAGRVVGAARAPESLAAQAVIDLTRDDLAAQLDQRGGPVDIAVDPLWGPYVHPLLACLAPGGRYLSVGSAAGAASEVSGARLRANRLSITGFTGTTAPVDDVTRAYEVVANWAAAGRFEQSLRTYGLASIREAWHAQRRPGGHKIVLTID